MNLTEAIKELREARWPYEGELPLAGPVMQQAWARRRDALDLAIAVLEEKATVAPARKTDPETSHRAAPEEIKAGSAREKVLAAAYDNWVSGGRPMSARELTSAAGLGHQRSPWKRVSELAKAGFLQDVWTKLDLDSKREVLVYEITKKGVAEASAIRATR